MPCIALLGVGLLLNPTVVKRKLQNPHVQVAEEIIKKAMGTIKATIQTKIIVTGSALPPKRLWAAL